MRGDDGLPHPVGRPLAVATLVVVAAAIMARRHLGRRWPSGAHIPEVAVLLSALAVLYLSMLRRAGWASAAGHDVPYALVRTHSEATGAGSVAGQLPPGAVARRRSRSSRHRRFDMVASKVQDDPVRLPNQG
jgi:hypothetical protein